MKRLSLAMLLVLTLGVLTLASTQAAANEQFSLRAYTCLPHERWTPGCNKGHCSPCGQWIPFQMIIRNAVPGKTYRADIWFDWKTTKKNLLGIVAFTDESHVNLAGQTVAITGGTATWAASYVGPEKYQNVWKKRLAVTIVANGTEVVLPWWAQIGDCAQAALWSGATLDVRFVWTGLHAEDIIPPGERTVPIMINPAIPTYNLSGYKWHDLDGDGVWDPGEPPLANWVIDLYDGLGWLGSDVTDGTGYYEFTNLLAGTYTVCEQLQEGWTQTFPVNCHTVTLGPDATNLNFGNFQHLTVTGCKFDDKNGNGIQDPGEPGIAGWGIALSGAASASTVTNAKPIFSVNTETTSDQSLSYFDFVLIGLIGLALMNGSVQGIAITMARYREDKILKRITTTPLRPWKFVLAEVLARLVLNVLQISLILAIGVWGFHAHLVGNIFLLYLFGLLGGLLFLSLGFAVASVARTSDAAQGMSVAITIPMMFLAGVFFPIDQLPKWLFSIVQYLPLAPLLRMIRQIGTENISPLTNPINIVIVVTWIIVALLVSIWRFRLADE